MAWKLAQCALSDKDKLNSFLGFGWEPFAVTEMADGMTTVWLRCEAHRPDAFFTDKPHPERSRDTCDDYFKAGGDAAVRR